VKSKNGKNKGSGGRPGKSLACHARSKLPESTARKRILGGMRQETGGRDRNSSVPDVGVSSKQGAGSYPKT